MIFDTRTIVLVVDRLLKLRDRPPLFSEGMRPDRISQRIDRVFNWLGLSGRVVAGDYVRRRETPPSGKRKWARGGFLSTSDHSPETIP